MSNNDEDLSKEVCEACSPNAKRLTASEEKLLLKKLPSWNIKNHQNVPQITKQFNFDNFQQAIKFANQVGGIAELAGHHPAILIEWGKVEVTWWSHEMAGLHRNDFIMASKTDDIFEN